MLNAMILAAGAGTRLRPLTYEIPKPMVPIVNRPVLHHVLANALRHGVKEAAINLFAHAEQIRRYCGDGYQWSMSLRYSREPRLLGTAGAVKKMESFLRGGTFFVLSGDGLHDVDLGDMLKFHRDKRSLATMAIKRVDSKFEYGVTLTDGEGRIKGFREKPMWSDVFSNKVNTGIYIFEPQILKLIPAGQPYDFGHQLWPRLLKARKRIFAYDTAAYWTDVGNLTEYRRSHLDVLNSRVKVTVPGTEMCKGVWIDEGASVSPKAKLEPPVVIGKGARVAAGAVLGPYTVIGEGSQVGAGARLCHTVLWSGVVVGPNAHLSNCIVGANGRVRESIAVYEATVLNFWADGRLN